MATLNAKASQEFVPIQEVRDGVIIVKDGSLRSIVMASSLNFALKSSDEQQSIIYQFQNFINSLDFPVQFFIQSKKLDIRPYLNLLEDRYKEQTIELMRIQTREYIEFIRAFVENTNIMTKSFFVVVPYTPVSASLKQGVGSLLRSNKNAAAQVLPNELFDEYRGQLAQRVGVVEQGLVRCGIRIAELGSEEVVELFYKLFNPGDTEKPIQQTQNI
jgi:type IV secretory pathway VirB4 component